MTIDETRRAFQERGEAEIARWRAELERLRTEARRTKAAVEADLKTGLDVLRKDVADAETKLHELKDIGDEAWDAAKAGVEKV